MRIAIGVAGLLIFAWGGLLLYYLASGRVPPRLHPIIRVWVRRGEAGDVGVNIALWALFSVLAGAVLTIIGLSALMNH